MSANDPKRTCHPARTIITFFEADNCRTRDFLNGAVLLCRALLCEIAIMPTSPELPCPGDRAADSRQVGSGCASLSPTSRAHVSSEVGWLTLGIIDVSLMSSTRAHVSFCVN